MNWAQIGRAESGADFGRVNPIRVHAVIVVWRKIQRTLDAISSLDASEYELANTICVAQEVATVDLEKLQHAAKQITVMESPSNLGFATAANLGVNAAFNQGASHVLLLNDDATVDPLCVGDCLREIAVDPRIGVVAPAVAYTDRPERLWFGGGKLSKWFGLAWHQGHLAGSSSPPASRDSDYVPSCCVLISKEIWKDVGSFREDYFMYFEDVEWGERARRAGWRLRYLGNVRCWHLMAGSSETAGTRFLAGDSAYYLSRNPVLFARDTRESLLRLTRLFGTVFIWSLYNFSRIRPSDWKRTGRGALDGIFDGLRGVRGARVPSTTR